MCRSSVFKDPFAAQLARRICLCWFALGIETKEKIMVVLVSFFDFSIFHDLIFGMMNKI